VGRRKIRTGRTVSQNRERRQHKKETCDKPRAWIFLCDVYWGASQNKVNEGKEKKINFRKRSPQAVCGQNPQKRWE